MTRSPDPYKTLGIARSATDAELRAAYRRLVQLHHPDHNGGSAESARRFEAVQEAYAEVRRLRTSGGRGPSARPGSAPSGDPDLDARVAAMEQELKTARAARERAAREARQATEQTIRDVREMAGERPTDEELGYYTTTDSFSKILDDAASELAQRVSEARDSPAGHRVSDLVDELASKLTGERHKPK
jgi:multidrug efflux pump subunit AcrA (membrane-fusion protein)